MCGCCIAMLIDQGITLITTLLSDEKKGELDERVGGGEASLLLSPLNLNYKLTLVHWTWSSKDHQPEWVCVCVTHQTHSWKVSIAAEILDSMLWTWVGWAGHRVSSTKGHRDGPAVCFMHIRILVVCNKVHMFAQHETGQRSALKASLAFSIVNIPKMHASWRDTHMHTQAISAGMYVKHFV